MSDALRRRVLLAVVVIVGTSALVVVLPVLVRLTAGPSFVDRISFDNRSEYDLLVEVTGAERDGWLILGTARRETTTTVEEVIDQGDDWIFRFFVEGGEAGELRVERSRLEGDRWKVAVPERVAAELRAKGAPPSP